MFGKKRQIGEIADIHVGKKRQTGEIADINVGRRDKIGEIADIHVGRRKTNRRDIIWEKVRERKNSQV